MEIHHPDKEIYNDLFVLDWMCTNVCVCVCLCMSIRPCTYFLWKACLHGQIPSSSFCLNSSKHTAQIWKRLGELGGAFCIKPCIIFSFVLVKRTNTHTQKKKTFTNNTKNLTKTHPKTPWKNPKTTVKSPTDQLCLLYNSDATLMGTCSVRGQEATHYSSFGFPLFNRKTINTVMQMVRDYQFISGVVS